MRRRLFTWFILLGVLLVAAWLCRNDHLLFERPARLNERYQGRIAQKLRDRGIVAYWDFDEAQVVERMSLGGSTTDGTRLVPGRFGGARRFLEEERGFLETTVPWASLGDECTIGMWLRVPDPWKDYAFLGDHYTRFLLEIRAGRVVFTSRGEDDDAVLEAAVPVTNAFFHVALSVSASKGEALLYVDGKKSARTALPGLREAKGEVTFGQNFYSAAPQVDIDDAAFWSRVLTSEEIGGIAGSAGKSLGMTFAGRDVRRAGRNLLVRDSLRSLARAMDLFDPHCHPSRIYRSDLPRVDLVLTRADLRCLNSYQNRCVENGLNALDTSEKRTILVTCDGETHAARVEIIADGYDTAVGRRRKAYAINIGEPGEDKSFRRLLLEPPEALSFMRFALAGELSRLCGYPSVKPELCVLSVNGGFQGLYFLRRADDEAELMLLNRIPRDCGGLIGSFPVSREDALAAFDRLAGGIVPLLYSDPMMPLGHREIRRAVADQREQVGREVSIDRFAGDAERVHSAAEYLSERLLTGSNPAAEYVVGNLDLTLPGINGVAVEFESRSPGSLESDGRVTRPASEPVEAVLLARLRRGMASEDKRLRFGLVPTKTCLPLLRMEIDGEARAFARRPCMVEILEQAGAVRSGPYPARVKWRGNTTLFYPKKNYSLKMDSPYDFLGMGRSRYLLTTAWMKDGSLMRETLSYEFFGTISSTRAASIGPGSRHVEITVDGRYQGISGLGERIDGSLLGFDRDLADSDRRGVLYKAVGASADFRTPHLRAIIQREPHWRTRKYWDPYLQLIATLGNPDPGEFRRNVNNVVDVDNLIDFQILVNLTQNGDGVNHNLYLARNSGEGNRFYIVPYDYDKTFHRSVTNGWFGSFLFNRLQSDLPGYCERLDARWKDLRRGVLSEDAVLARVDRIERNMAMGGALERNFRLWSAPEGRPHERQVEEIRDWLTARLKLMDATIEELAATGPRAAGKNDDTGGNNGKNRVLN